MKAVQIILFAALATLCTARELKQDIPGRLTFYSNANYTGDIQMFQFRVPGLGCGDCNDMAAQSYDRDFHCVCESYVSNAGSYIILYSDHTCTGMSTGLLPAGKGAIRGGLANAVNSFRMCY